MRAATVNLDTANSVLRRAFPGMEIEYIGDRPILMGAVGKLPGESAEQTAERLFGYVGREVDSHLPEPADFIVGENGDARVLKGTGKYDINGNVLGRFEAISPGQILFHSGA